MSASRWIWTTSHIHADTAPLDGFARMALLRFSGAVADRQVNFGAFSTQQDYFYTDRGQPGIAGSWPGLWFNDLTQGSEGWEVQINVIQAKAGISVDLRVDRVDSIGNFIEAVTATAAGVSLSATGLISVVLNAGQVQSVLPVLASDRVRLSMLFSSASKTAGSVILRMGDPLINLLWSPLPMANPRIVWNGNNLDFPVPPSSYRAGRRANRVLEWSDGGVAGSLLKGFWDEVRLGLSNFDSQSFEDSLRAWWAWAGAGKQWSFALDSGNVQDRTMSSASTTTAIFLASTAGFVAGNRYLARSATGSFEEVFTVLSITANVSLNISGATPLKNAYVSGDVVRSLDYYPKVVSLDDQYPVARNITTWSLDLSFREDRG